MQATLKSDNTVYAQLAADLGESTVTEMAHKMGVVSPLKSYAAEALGGLTLGVTPLEMANVYATLADGGWRNTPIAITKVVFPDGHVDDKLGQAAPRESAQRRGDRRGDPDPQRERRERHAGRSAITCPSGGQDGDDERTVDAWLDGYTPNYSTAVWMGYPTKRVSMTDVHGEPQQGGYLPAEIWHAYMSAVIEGKTCEQFRTGQGIAFLQPVLRQIRDHRAVALVLRIEEGEKPANTRSRSHETHAPAKGGAGRAEPAGAGARRTVGRRHRAAASPGH